jgi:hypothetical protein
MMYQLQNDQLSVELLDPAADVEKLGSRYCTGGYIWQITDAGKGHLLAGPHYPSPKPRVFDGQGAPDMFHLPLGAEQAAVGDDVMCIGVGLVRRTSPKEPFDVRYNPVVSEWVKWNVEKKTASITMTTQHTALEWSYKLVRTVSLQDRVVSSRTKMTNLGNSDLPIRWFPHPFFPLTKDNVLCDFSLPFTVSESPGYVLGEDGFVHRIPDFNWARGGCYLPIKFTPSTIGLTVVQKHDLVGNVTAVTDYNPSFLPIWGNQNTFSFEPYLERLVSPGGSTDWKISYTF